MILNSSPLFNLVFKNLQFYLIFNRLIRNSQITFIENELLQDVKPKEKITVIKKKLLSNNQTSVVEWKTASSVIKGLNTEYKYLYGPVQTSKTNTHNLIKDHTQQIIQHETRIPIIEPSADYQNKQMYNNEQKTDISSILTFPLTNNCIHPTNQINKLNFLRKHLEFLCKDSPIPSVSLILETTMSKERKEILDRWKQSMISQLGEEGFEAMQSENLARGISLHHSICSYLVSTPESELHIKEENIGHWKSLKHILPNIGDVKLLEEFVMHPFLYYRGVVDCLAQYRNHLVVIDWKTSKKSKANIKNTYDNPLQIAAYIGALNFDPKYQYLVNKGLIVVAYENGMPGTTHFLDEATVKYYWNEWLQRVKQFWEKRSSQTEIS